MVYRRRWEVAHKTTAEDLIKRQRLVPPDHADKANEQKAARTHQGTLNCRVLTTKLMLNYIK